MLELLEIRLYITALKMVFEYDQTLNFGEIL